jgi:DegV family protein with EDD domain
MSIRIVTDSTCDLTSSSIDRHKIIVLPLYINFGNRSVLDGVDMSRAEFFEQLPNFNPTPTTAAPGTDMFKQAYTRLADEGATEILSIHISETLSAVVNVARVAANEFTRIPVTVIDSRQLSTGTGFIVESAAIAAEQGKSKQEILTTIQDLSKRTHVFAALDTLEFLKRSGRMNSAVAGIGSLLQLKPILRMHDGKATAERVRTSEHALRRIIEILKQVSPIERVVIVHAHVPKKAEELRERVKSLLPSGDVPAIEITPVIGAHIGPGAIGFAVVSKKV